MATILYISANNPERSGADVSLGRIVLAAQASGHRPIVVLRRVSYLVELFERNSIPVIVLPILRLRATGSPVSKLGYPAAIARTVSWLKTIIQEYGVDLVHTNDFIDGLGNLAARLSGVPSCQHVRVIAPQRTTPLLLFLRRLTKYSNHIFCVSEAVRQAMFPSEARHVSVLYDWVEETLVHRSIGSASIRQELGLDNEVRLVGCVGRLEFWKGQHLFLEAAEKIAHQVKDVHFLIVGGPTTHKHEYATALADQRRRLAEPDRVTLLGYREDIPSIMHDLAIAVHASLLPEPFGLVVMEAMHAGNVVVAANAGGVREQIEDGVTGFLYKPGNVDEMAEKIVQALCLADPTQVGERARQSIERRFAKTPSLQALLNVYDELLAKQSLRNEVL